jgi:hypothetical protein
MIRLARHIWPRNQDWGALILNDYTYILERMEQIHTIDREFTENLFLALYNGLGYHHMWHISLGYNRPGGGPFTILERMILNNRIELPPHNTRVQYDREREALDGELMISGGDIRRRLFETPHHIYFIKWYNDNKVGNYRKSILNFFWGVMLQLRSDRQVRCVLTESDVENHRTLINVLVRLNELYVKMQRQEIGDRADVEIYNPISVYITNDRDGILRIIERPFPQTRDISDVRVVYSINGGKRIRRATRKRHVKYSRRKQIRKKTRSSKRA